MKQTKIVLCTTCNGTGKTQEEKCTDYHRNEYDYWDVKCSFCNGYGRRVQEIEIKERKMTEDDVKLEGRREA